MKRLRPAVAVVLCCGASVAAPAADQSLSDTVTGAFQTVVIDAQAAAAQATAAAKDALGPGVKQTSTKKKSKDKDAAKADGKSDPKSGETAADAAKSSDKPAKSEPAKADASKDAASKDAAKTTDGKQKSEPQKAAEPAKEAAGDKKDAAADSNAKADPNAKDAKNQKDAGKPPVPTEWPVVDIELARARCTQLLKGVDAVTIPEPPFRTGECGAPAPVRVVSIGKNPEVSFSPPAVMTCDMVANLAKWIQKDVQPLARRHLGSEVISLESMSDYSCRHAYGRVGNKLSEHGKANALDIRGFVTRKGQTAHVLAGWGQTRRDVLKEIAAAKAAAEKAEAVKAAAEKADRTRAEMAAAAASEAPAATAAPIPRKTIVEGLPKESKKTGSPLALPASVTKEGLAMAPTHLGGPKENAGKAEDGKKKGKSDTAKGEKSKSKGTVTAALPPAGAEDEPEVKAPPPKDATSRFLHEAHAAACRIFGTTLGPEANEAHRNHFHVDMAERKVRKICD